MRFSINRLNNNFTLALLSVILITGLTLVFWNNYNQNKNISEQIALEDAKNFAYSVSQFRNFYSKKILPPLREKNITITHAYLDIPGSVPLPATFAKDFGAYLSSKSQSYQVRLYSDKPFSWRKNAGPRDAFERDAIEATRKHPDQAFWRIEKLNNKTVLRYAVADKLKASCVACHNSYPGTPKTDWKEGDVRGVLQVIRPVSGLNHKLERNAFETFAYMIAMALLAILMLALMMRRLTKTLNQSQTLVGEKTEMNAKLNQEIANRDKLTAELNIAKDRALESSKLKSQFLANMSHEIRTPMNGIIGMTHLLQDTQLDATQKELADTVCDSAESLLFIINDILDFSKIEAGKLSIETKPFELRPLITGVFKLLDGKVDQDKIDIGFELDVNLPQYVSSDEMRLRQILFNLLGNAIKFTQNGSIKLYIAWSDNQHTHLKFAIQDTGIGIPDKAKQKLFKAFSQVDGSTTRLYGGTGLGLTISQQLSNLLGGEINVESEEGEGSTFWFTIQCHPFTEADIKQLENKATIPAAEKQSQPDKLSDNADVKLLLVEDNLVNQKLAIALLKKIGYQADLAQNGQIAIDMLQQQAYDLVLMDCQMPIKDGYQATEEIRRFDTALKDIPIIAMTANAMQGDDEKCYASGMSDYLTKPINPALLKEKLDYWVKFVQTKQS